MKQDKGKRVIGRKVVFQIKWPRLSEKVTSEQGPNVRE